MSGDLVNGVIALLRALELDPNNVDFKEEMAVMYFALGDTDAARHWLDRLSKDHPNQIGDAPLEYLWLWLDDRRDAALDFARVQVQQDQAAGSTWFEAQLIKDMLRGENYAKAESALLKLHLL